MATVYYKGVRILQNKVNGIKSVSVFQARSFLNKVEINHIGVAACSGPVSLKDFCLSATLRCTCDLRYLP